MTLDIYVLLRKISLRQGRSGGTTENLDIISSLPPGVDIPLSSITGVGTLLSLPPGVDIPLSSTTGCIE